MPLASFQMLKAAVRHLSFVSFKSNALLKTNAIPSASLSTDSALFSKTTVLAISASYSSSGA
jgi:hypothetical protein